MCILAACTITVDPVDEQPSLVPTATVASVAVAQSLAAGVLPTDVTYVQTLVTINLRSGPGLSYAQVSIVEEGETTPVFGISADNNWWLVLCPDNTMACWITAGPSYTQPTLMPADSANSDPLGDDLNDTNIDDTNTSDTNTSEGDLILSDSISSDSGEAIVEDLAVRLLEASPLQIEAVVSGLLPDACAFVETMDAVREGRTYYIRMTVARQPEQRCAPALTPFEEATVLDITGLPAGDYEVRVDEFVTPFALAVAAEPAPTPTPTVETAPEATPTPAIPVEPGPAVVEQILPMPFNDPAQSVQGVNVTIFGYVSDTCTDIGAINQRQEGNTFFIDVTTTGRTDIECIQEITRFERTIPLNNIAGLPAGEYEVIVNNVSQRFNWPGPGAVPPDLPTETPTETPTVLPGDIPTETPTETPTQLPGEIPTETPTATPTVATVPPTEQTDVNNIEALRDIPIYNGPGADNAIIGQLFNGESASVIDRSLDGNWWHINCSQDPQNNCWVSTNPAFTAAVQTGE